MHAGKQNIALYTKLYQKGNELQENIGMATSVMVTAFFPV